MSCLKKRLPILLVLIPAAALVLTGCGGGGGGSGAAKVAEVFNSRDVNLYTEVPAILVQGNTILRDNTAADPASQVYSENRSFNPQTPTTAELFDSDKDGIEDALINDFESYANAANRLLDIDLAACAGITPNNEQGYSKSNPGVWAAAWAPIAGTSPVRYKYQLPDTMPESAGSGGTKGTQFIQMILPFVVNPASLFDANQANAGQKDYLNSNALTIEDEDGNHVFATVLVNGKDFEGNDAYADHPNWSQLSGVNIKPAAGQSTIVFVAQASAGVKDGFVPFQTAFNVWSNPDSDEIRIHLKKVTDAAGTVIDVNSKWVVLKESGTPEPPKVLKVEATDPVKDGSGNNIVDPGTGDILVSRDTSFILTFDKPIVPETVAQSIVFDGAPFNGNTGTLSSNLVGKLLLDPNPCVNGNHIDPIAPNVALVAELILGDGTLGTGTQGIIPFRCHPIHQNNLSTFVLNPVIELPGSSDLGIPLFSNPSIQRIQLTVYVYPHDANSVTGQVSEISPPVNMGAAGLFGETMTTSFSTSFTVSSGGRYVNAPVSPHALYYAMGPKGLGVVDLDGNGFTTNDPDFSKIALVTSAKFYSIFGNGSQGNGNDFAYGARAVRNNPNVPAIGLGNSTPMPGINEGSTGVDEVVRDSNGNPQLFPDPTGELSKFNITDVEVGDFLDTIFFDGDNVWAKKSFHLSAINLQAEGNFVNNLISTPPTPNPPPLTLPIGMRATHVILDDFDLSEEGAFVIMGKEVFTVDLVSMGLPAPVNTGFVHLLPAELAGSPSDEAFPPNASNWPNIVKLPTQTNFMNTGPVAESSTIGVGWFYGSRQQIGNFLFAADKANNTVHVLNSNSMEVITTLTGLNQPESLAVTTDLKRLYVSNSGAQSVTVFNVDPKSEDFLFPVTEIQVGSLPKGIAVQPDMEDVFVCNHGSNSISIINPKTNSVRKTLTSLVNKPWDMVAGPRQTVFGFLTGVYHGYISNFGGNNVLVYESGPDGVGGIGFDDILDPVPEKGAGGLPVLPIQSPRGICWDPNFLQQGFLTGGCYVAHSSGGFAAVSRIQFVAQQAPLGPIFLIPNAGSVGGTPGFGKRKFEITSQWGGNNNPLTGSSATDVAVLDFNRGAWEDENWNGNFYTTNVGDLGQNPSNQFPINNKHAIRFLFGVASPTTSPDRLYISYQFTPAIDVLNPESGQIEHTVTGLPAGAKVIKTYFKQ